MHTLHSNIFVNIARNEYDKEHKSVGLYIDPAETEMHV